MNPKKLEKNVKCFKKLGPVRRDAEVYTIVFGDKVVSLKSKDFEDSSTLRSIVWCMMSSNLISRRKLFMDTKNEGLKSWLFKFFKDEELSGIYTTKMIVYYSDIYGRCFDLESITSVFSCVEEAIETVKYYLINDDFNWNYEEVGAGYDDEILF